MKQPEPHCIFSGHNGAIYDAAFWEAKSAWVTAGGDGVVAMWGDDQLGRAILHHQQAFYSVLTHEDWLFAGSSNGELFASHGGTAPQRLVAHEQGLFALVLHENRLWTGGGLGQILAWKCQNQTWRVTERIQLPNLGKVRMFLPLGEAMLVGTSDGLLGTIKEGLFTPFLSVPKVAHYAAVHLPEKDAFLTGDADGHLRAYRRDGSPVLAFPAHQGPVYRVVVCGDVIWSASRDKTIKAWHSHDLRPLAKIEVGKVMQRRSINALSVKLRSEGHELLAGGDNRLAHVYRLTHSGFHATNLPHPPDGPEAIG